MSWALLYHPILAFLTISFSLVVSAESESTCGALITYRQLSTILESAPACFRNGCGGTNSSTSMSSGCPASAPCSQLWGYLKADWENKDWCQSCGNNIACRIPGWPIWNATQTCNTEPHAYLFGTDGDCCTNDDEPAQLSKWMGPMCNGTQWENMYFNNYGFMAKQDWEEWIIPRNLTITPEGIPVDQWRCSKSPLYMGTLFFENVLYLAVALGIGFLRLLYIYRKEKEFNRGGRMEPGWGVPHLPWLPLRWFQKDTDSNPFEPGWWTKSFFGAILPLSVGTVTAGAQVGINFLSAYLVSRATGYGHIDWTYLGLLFCCRPRLTWLACVLGLFREKLPRAAFHSHFSKTAAKATLASVAISSTISEGLLQIVGLYYMGITANSGRMKGFYYSRHLLPYWKGHEAMFMYAGALLWLVACIPIILIWPIIAYNQTSLFRIWRRIRLSSIYRTLRLPQPDPPHPTTVSDISFNEERVGIFRPDAHDYNEPIPGPSEFQESADDFPRVHNEEDFQEHATLFPGRRPPGSRPSNINSASLNEPIRGSSIPYPRWPPYNRGGEDSSPSIHPEEMNEPITPSTSTAGPSRARAYIRGGAGYADETMGYSSYEMVNFNRIRDRNRERARQRALSNRQEYNEVRQTFGGYLRGGLGSAYEESINEKHVADRQRYEQWASVVIPLGIVIGLISYIAQWLFWAGFVKASGDRYCHPHLLTSGALWGVGSILAGVLPFGLQ